MADGSMGRRTLGRVARAIGGLARRGVQAVRSAPFESARQAPPDAPSCQPLPVTGGHAVLGANRPNQRWYFAECYTGTDFDVYLAILNPADVVAEVELTYFLADAEPIVRRLSVPARRRATVTVHTGPQGIGHGQAAGLLVSTTSEDGIVAERLTYFRYFLTPPVAGLIPDQLIPPPELQSLVGGGDFQGVGSLLFRNLLDAAGLRPEDDLLDVGCGSGRVAAALTQFLAPTARYEGFDIVPAAIDWCRSAITPAYPNFTFHHADIYNKDYNAGGRLLATEYRFPFASASFDLVFLTSVFTHMLPEDVQHYLDEIARVLRPGGRCFVTFFLMNDAVRRRLAQGRSAIAMKQLNEEGYWTMDRTTPERAIAFEEAEVLDWFAQRHLAVPRPIYPGNWSGLATGLTYQDVIVATKTR